MWIPVIYVFVYTQWWTGKLYSNNFYAIDFPSYVAQDPTRSKYPKRISNHFRDQNYLIGRKHVYKILHLIKYLSNPTHQPNRINLPIKKLKAYIRWYECICDGDENISRSVWAADGYSRTRKEWIWGQTSNRSNCWHASIRSRAPLELVEATNERNPWDSFTASGRQLCHILVAMGCMRQQMERTTYLRCLVWLICGIWCRLAYSHLARNMEIDMKIGRLWVGGWL